MKQKSLLSIFIFSLFMASPAWAKSTEKQLRAAEAQVKSKNYHEAIRQAKPLLDSLALDTVEEIILAHRILGVSYCELGDQAKAIDHFKSLLTFSPREKVNDLTNSNLCSQMYAELQGGGTGYVKPVQASPSGSSPATTTKKEVNLDGTWKRYMPFGTGQFANGESNKGWAFLGGEVAAVGAATVSFFLFRAERNSDGTFDNASKASAYRAMYWSFAGVGVGVAAWGIIDAVLVHKRLKKERGLASYKGFSLDGPTMISYRF